MKVDVDTADGRLTWTISPEAGPPEADPSDAMQQSSVRFTMPEGWSYSDLHPDLEAVAVLLALRPYIGSALQLPRPISAALAEVLHDAFSITVAHVDDTLPARRIDGGRVGLCFSGGVDSSAALLTLPDDTVCFFLDRSPPPPGITQGLYRPEAARHACERVESLGWAMVTVASDLEFVRKPVGFPVFDRSSVESSGVPVVLCAGSMQLDAISWGTIAGVAYGTAFGGFIDHAAVTEHERWRRVFAAVGLPVLNPIAGASEIASSRMVLGSSLEGTAQSCVRGRLGEPCRNCWKCVRKILVASALTGDWPAPEQMERLLLVRELRRHLHATPFPLSDVLCYALSRYPGSSDLVDVLRKRLACGVTDLAYLEHWYAPVKAVWPAAHAEEVEQNLDASVGRMSGDEESRFRRWDPMQWEDQPAVRAFALASATYFDALADDVGRWTGLSERKEPFRQSSLDGPIEDEDLRARREQLERLKAELAGLRSSTSFTRGHRLVTGVKVRVGRLPTGRP